MKNRLWLILLVAVGLYWSGTFGPARGEEKDQTALASALQGVPTSLEAGLMTSERQGKPISAKFEIEDGKLQLSVYTVRVTTSQK